MSGFSGLLGCFDAFVFLIMSPDASLFAAATW
jgi:hypothetical protein